MFRRSAGVLVVAAAASQCTLLTDFDGIADSKPDASSDGAAGTGNDEPTFPRLALYETANPKDFDDPLHQAEAARVHLGIMGIYPGWELSHGPVEQVVQNVKALNPKTKLFMLFGADRFENTTGGAYQTVVDKLNAMSWWLYESGTSGTIVPNPGTSSTSLANPTLFTPEDADGYTFIEWQARWSFQTFIEPTPSLDGVLIDGLDWKPAADGDFDRDGTTDAADSAQAGSWYREGFARYFSDLKALAPNTLQLATLDSLAETGAAFSELEGVLHGGIVSDLIGRSYSKEQQSWYAMMAHYRRALEVSQAPKLVVFHMLGALTDYRTLRYGLASCLLDDGYFAFTDVNGASWGLEWFDEYDAELGHATSPPPTVAWSQGVWRRDFEGGIALVNPKGNGPVTVDLEAPFKHLSGAQDPIVNDGSVTENVSLEDRDGVILLREQ